MNRFLRFSIPYTIEKQQPQNIKRNKFNYVNQTYINMFPTHFCRIMSPLNFLKVSYRFSVSNFCQNPKDFTCWYHVITYVDNATKTFTSLKVWSCITTASLPCSHASFCSNFNKFITVPPTFQQYIRTNNRSLMGLD